MSFWEKSLEHMLWKILKLFDLTDLPRLIGRHRDLFGQMVRRFVEQRYRGSVLGLLWSFVHPLLMLCVYTFVFSVVFKAKWGVSTEGGRGAFAVIMFCGMSLYSLFSDSVSSSCGCIVGNPNFVKKVIFPVEILPASQVLGTFVLGIPWIVLLLAGAYFILGFIGWTMLLLPIILLPLIVFSLGVSYFVASLSVYVRDTQYVVGVVLQILFFATPIFYPISAVPMKFRPVLEFNPLTILIEEARKVFLYGRLPDWEWLGIAALVSLAILQLGYFFFIRTRRGFADVL